MRTYLKTIQNLQKLFLGISIAILLILPIVLAFFPDSLSPDAILRVYDVSHVSVFLVMLIRPLADIFFTTRWIRPLVILRKGVGVLSASVVVAFIFSKIIIDPIGYISSFATASYWSLANYALLAHLADISAILLIVTSNNLSKRLLGAWWKRIQRLSYIYFYASSLYVFLAFGTTSLLFSIYIITFVTVLAYVKNMSRTTATIQTT